MTLSTSMGASEEAELLRRITHQHVLGLLVVVEHHAVGFATDARLLVTAEGRVRRIGVVAIGPDAPGLDAATEAIRPRTVARPYTRTQAVKRVVGDLERFLVCLE